MLMNEKYAGITFFVRVIRHKCDQSCEFWDVFCSVHFFGQMDKSHISNKAGDRFLLF